MRRNKHCSRSRRPGGARRKGLCERQEAIKLHSAAAGSARAQRSPPITRGGGCGGKGRRPAAPAQCPTPGAIRAGACQSAARDTGGHLSRPPAPPPGLAPPHVSACGRTPRRSGTRSPARGSPSGPQGRAVEPPPGARQAPAAAASPSVSRPLPGEGAVGQAWPLSLRGARGPPPRRQPRDPYPAARPPAAEGHRRAGDMGGAPPPSSGASSRDPLVPLSPAPRFPDSPGSADPGAPRCASSLSLPDPRCREAPPVCPAALPVTSSRFDVGHPPLPSRFL